MKKQGVLIAPSIMGADLACLGDAARNIEESGANLIHIDVMDGKFVEKNNTELMMDILSRILPLVLESLLQLIGQQIYFLKFML